MASQEVKLLAARMMRVFQGNKEGHYTADFRNVTIEKDGKRVPVYKNVLGPLTQKEFEDHLEGKAGLLVVPVTQAGACRWGKIDTDDYAGDSVERAKKYAQKIARWNLPLVPELTKSGGCHLSHYSPYTESADDMRAKLADWGADLHIKPGTELFPKQGKLNPGEIGSGINLPYFGGDNEDCRNYAVDKEGTRFKVAQWLDIIENMPATAGSHPGNVDVEGAAALLAKYWTSGNRDNLNLAVLGALLRAGVDTGLAQEVQDAVMSVCMDDGKHANVAQVEVMMDDGKKVPGFSKLAEYIGYPDANEFMRLAGTEPPKDLVSFDIRPIPAHWSAVVPPPVIFAVTPLFPKQVAAVVAAEGGAGKTGFGLYAALCVATGRPFFGLPVTQGAAVYIALEENENSLHRRFFKIIGDEVRRMEQEGLSPDAIAEFHAAHQANLFPVAAAGVELHVIRGVKGGDVGINELVIERLIEKMPPAPTLVVMDPVARTHGNDENSNSVSTALINAGERIAQRTGAAFVYMHHIGKEAIRARDTSMNAARGGSALIAGARSSIRLAPVVKTDQFTNVPVEVILAGELIEVIHNKLNDGAKAKPFFLRRQELSFELFTPELSTQEAQRRKALAGLFNWYANRERKGFSQNKVIRDDDTRLEIFGFAISRDRAERVIKDALEDGDLIKSDEAHPDNPNAKLLHFRADFENPM
jgi:hypothetical protein